MLETHTKEIVKSTVPLLKEYGEDITKVFYRELFSRYPEVKGMFDMEKQKSGQQPKALAMAILNAAKNIDNLEKIHHIEGTGAGVPVLCSYVKICDIKNTYLNIARNLRF